MLGEARPKQPIRVDLFFGYPDKVYEQILHRRVASALGRIPEEHVVPSEVRALAMKIVDGEVGSVRVSEQVTQVLFESDLLVPFMGTTGDTAMPGWSDIREEGELSWRIEEYHVRLDECPPPANTGRLKLTAVRREGKNDYTQWELKREPHQ